MGFQYSKLAELAKRHDFVIGKCVYKEEDQLRLVTELVEELVAYYDKLPARKTENIKSEFRGEVVSRFNKYAPLIKDYHFSSEKEWRLISTVKMYSDEKFGFREGTSMLIPYFKFPLVLQEDDAIELEEVVVGPCPNSELASQAIMGLLISNKCKPTKNQLRGIGAPTSPDVRTSKIPFRNW